MLFNFVEAESFVEEQVMIFIQYIKTNLEWINCKNLYLNTWSKAHSIPEFYLHSYRVMNDSMLIVRDD